MDNHSISIPSARVANYPGALTVLFAVLFCGGGRCRDATFPRFRRLLALRTMSRRSDPDDPRRPNRIKPPDVDKTDQRIHDAVAECVQQAAEENGTTAEFVFRHVQQLIQQGWNPDDAELVGSRALGVLNAMNHPPPTFGS